MQIRGAVPEDAPALRELYLSSRRDNFTWLDATGFRLADFDRDTEGEDISVAVEGGEIIGFISLWLPDNFVHHLHVRNAHRGEGVGKALLDAGLARLQMPATLKCMTLNVRAAKFYSDHGWRIRDAGAGPDGPYYLFERAD
jgi:ribosomal protein S18 acetylase RimI-like enzyme